jgi:hypothetical protein
MNAIVCLTVALDDVDPAVWRRIEVPVGLGLDRLHLVIQAAMGWENAHLFEFRAGRRIAYGIPDPDWPQAGLQDASKASLADLLQQAPKSFHYVYDFGDDWPHTVKVEALGDAQPEALAPRLIAAQGRCPPEDVGGPPGFAAFQEAMADRKHPGHRDAVEWYGGIFDSAKVDLPVRTKAVAGLAARWAKPKSAAKPQRTAKAKR